MRIEHQHYAPGQLVDQGDGHYSLIYSAFPDFAEVFTRKGLQGGGYTWHGMVVHLLRQHSPATLDLVDFDPEASMFCALSDNLDALLEVAKVLRKLEDRDTVERVVDTADDLHQYD